MKIRSAAAFVLVLAVLVPTALAAAPASPETLHGGDTLLLPAPTSCPAESYDLGTKTAGDPAVLLGLPFALPASGGSCMCGSGIQNCCGCNPCPPDGTGYCCGLDLGHGLCGEIRSCGCLAC